MSLNVSEEDVQAAVDGRMTSDKFIDIIRESLPAAFSKVESVVARVKKGELFASDTPASMDDESRGQLLRLFASTSMHRELENHYGVVLAFQNCHYIAAAIDADDPNFRRFTSIEAQVMSQHPNLRDC